MSGVHPNAEQRRRLKISREALAREIGVSPDALVSWELGRRPRRRPKNEAKWNATLAEHELQQMWKRGWENWDKAMRLADEEAWYGLLGAKAAQEARSDVARWAMVAAEQQAEISTRYGQRDSAGRFVARPEQGVQRWERPRRTEPPKAAADMELLVAVGKARQVG